MVELLGPPPGWPRPPFEWRYHQPQEFTGAHACQIDTIDNRWLRAFVLDVFPGALSWQIAGKASGPFVPLALARVARVTLSTPLEAASESVQHGPASIPVNAHECDYALRMATGQTLLRGQTVGHVETNDGVFLFAAQTGTRSLLRMFVPRVSQLNCVFGPTPAARACGPWIKDSATLREALSRQRGQRTPRIGEALQQLGFVSSQQIEIALREPVQHGRLGERLVRQGIIKPDQLQTALAFKLGIPLIDLASFQIDPDCAAMMPPVLAKQHCAVPILAHGRHLVIAVDDLATVAKLEALSLWPGRIIAPALALRGPILMALSALRGDDAWAQEAPWR